MSEITPNVARSIREAAAAAGPLIDHCIERAVAELQQVESRSTGAERQDAADGWRELLVQRKAWVSRFPLLLRTACDAAASGVAADAGPSTVRPSSLALVDDEEVQRNILSARLGEILSSKLDRPLADLDKLMSAAMALPGVQPERNPLRPQVYAQTLVKLMANPGNQSRNWPTLWLRAMEAPLRERLEKLYGEQAQALTQARIKAADYRVLGTPDRPGGASRFGALAANSAPGALDTTAQNLQPRGASAFAELATQELGGPVLREFLFRGGPQAQAPLAPSYYALVEAEIAAIQASQAAEAYDEQAVRRFQHVPAPERPARRVGIESPLPASTWGQFATSKERSLVRGNLKMRARQVGQVLGLEVVRKLVSQVAQDPRLLAPVREAIVALEPSLLRLAMVSPRFFSEEDHPGRRLVECVAERSFRYNDEFSVDFQAFFGPVTHTFNALNAIESFEDAQPFRGALGALQSGWAAQDALAESQEKPAFDAVRFAEQRQELAARIARDLGERSDLAASPEDVRSFLLGSWALVMAHARLTDTRHEIDPGGYVAVVAELLWSIQRDQALREPAKAFVVIPKVLVTLRRGLTLMGQPPEENAGFFLLLETLHRPVMKLRAKSRQQSGFDVPRTVEPVAAPAVAVDRPGVWMAENELRAAGFVEAPADAVRPAPGTTNDPLHLDEFDVETIIGNLQEGCWVDLHARNQWRRARLKWASTKASLFMFVSDGGLAHSMTRRSLERLVRERLLRPVDAEAVVPRALETIMKAPAQPAERLLAA
jgi:hypothetical protein